MLARYALVDSTGQVVNLVEWDGSTAFDVPRVVPIGANRANVGDYYDGSAFTSTPSSYAGLPVVSGSVRSKMPNGQGGTLTGGEGVASRHWDTTNVACTDPWFEFFHGRVQTNGSVGIDLELPLTGSFANQYRFAVLTNLSGVAANQSTATLTQATFFNMRNDPYFVALGGSVSVDGLTITVPAACRFRSDRMVGLTLSGPYFKQIDTIAADGSAQAHMVSVYGRSDLGDRNTTYAANSGNALVYSRDWTSAAFSTTSMGMPHAVLGSGVAGTKTVVVDGDSIICEAYGAGWNNSDIGDSNGVLCFAKRALSAGGYSFIDASVSGTNVRNFQLGWDTHGIRASLLQYANVVFTDHIHNDRRSGLAFTDATAGLRTLYNWHNAFLRTRAMPGARIVRCTLCPATNSTDNWMTDGGQTGKNDDSTWVSDYATNSKGNQYKLADLIMQRGTFSAVPRGGQNCDAGFDLYAALGCPSDGTWPVNGTANFATPDGTHPLQALHVTAASVLQSQLASLLGF